LAWTERPVDPERGEGLSETGPKSRVDIRKTGLELIDRAAVPKDELPHARPKRDFRIGDFKNEAISPCGLSRCSFECFQPYRVHVKTLLVVTARRGIYLPTVFYRCFPRAPYSANFKCAVPPLKMCQNMGIAKARDGGPKAKLFTTTQYDYRKRVQLISSPF
jgi:hypothetical protein